MAGTLLDLASRLDKKAEELGKEASGHAVKIALAMVGDLAFHTPVDKSQALSNWIVTLDVPTANKIGPHFPGLQGSTFRASAQATIETAKLVLVAKKPGQNIYITNNQPYIKKLNDGTHSQQPGGFLERALLLGRKLRFKFENQK